MDGHHRLPGPRRKLTYAVPMATVHPHLEPDPFDEKIEEMLRDPELVADLADQRAKLARGELKVHSNNEARKIVGLEPEPNE